MERIKKGIFWAVILSETSHVFCCVLPTVISVISLIAGAGLISALPGPVLAVHDMLHAYEIPMIAFSAFILLSGWGLHALSTRLDCRGTGCSHEPCAPEKSRTRTVLVVATVLFFCNLSVYLMFHAGHNDMLAEARHHAF